MKNYKEMADDVIRRIDEYETTHRKKQTKTVHIITSLCCVGLIAVLGFGLWKRGQFHVKPPEPLTISTEINEKNNNNENKEDIANTTSSSHSISNKLQEQIDELESQSSDSLGWIVYDGRIYLQINDIENIQLNKYLGYASEFQGFYQQQQLESQHPSNKVDGKLYSVLDNPDLIFVKLDNGGSVLLSANYLEYYGQ